MKLEYVAVRFKQRIYRCSTRTPNTVHPDPTPFGKGDEKVGVHKLIEGFNLTICAREGKSRKIRMVHESLKLSLLLKWVSYT